MKNTPFFGLTVFYPSWVKETPSSELITRLLKEYFNKEELTASNVRAIRVGFGNCVSLECDLNLEGYQWSVKEIFQASGKAA